MSSSSNRLLGIEFAYSFALIGCVMYIFLFTIGDKVLSILSHQEFSTVLDFFPALFFFLNGMTITLTMRDKRISRSKLLAYQGKRGSVLFLLGLALCMVWPMNMLVIAGIMYFLSQYIAVWNNGFLGILVAAVVVLGMSLLLIGVPTTVQYAAPTLQGGNMINLSGFLFFNGYFSVIPWSVFFLTGMLFGRVNVSSKGLFPPSSILGVVMIITSFVLEQYSKPMQELFLAIDYHDSVFLKLRFFYLPFLFYAIGMAVCLVNVSLFAFSNVSNKKVIKFVQTLSSMKYSILFFQIIIGLLITGFTNSHIYINKMVLIVTVMVATSLTLYFAVLWKKRIHDQGPVEYVVKKIVGSTKKD